MGLMLRRQRERLTGVEVLARLRTRLPGAMRDAVADTRLSDLSIDSLDIVELLCLIDDEFAVRLADGEFQELRTVGELAERVARASALDPTASGMERRRS